MEQISCFNIRVTNNDTKTFIERKFKVEKEYSKLVFDVNYSPKYLYDKEICVKMMKEEIIRASYSNYKIQDEEIMKHVPLKNHISWTIYSPKSQLGTKHKHDSHQELSISEFKSSDGFENSKIYCGEWKIKIGLTAILTEFVDISIKIIGEV